MQQKLEELWGLEEDERTAVRGSLEAPPETVPREVGTERAGVPCGFQSMGSGL